MDNKKNPQVITLISDFGLQDEYVGVMKGVIYKHAPRARIVDISHLIPPQAIGTASHLLSRSYKHFPDGTVHLVVVDPGVGSNRAILAIATGCQYFVGPDNGVLTPILNQTTLVVHQVNFSRLQQKNISSTFHGRDIMAPLAGQLASGLNIAEIGPQIAPDQCRRLQAIVCTRLPHTLEGEVIHVDAFGNLCTNICRHDIEDFASGNEIAIQITQDFKISLNNTYDSQTIGAVLALYDSHDFLEIAVNQGNAAQQLLLAIGSKIIVSHREYSTTKNCSRSNRKRNI